MSGGKYDIIIKGFAGSRGAAFLASENMDMIDHRFRQDYLKEQMDLLMKDIDCDLFETHVYEDGILRALFDMAEDMRCGISIEQKRIPIRQFTIEISELFGKNPYRIPTDAAIELCGNGDMKEGIHRAKELRRCGIPAECIGYTTNDHKKLITDKTAIEFINKD